MRIVSIYVLIHNSSHNLHLQNCNSLLMKHTNIKVGTRKSLKFLQYCQNANFVLDKGIPKVCDFCIKAHSIIQNPLELRKPFKNLNW